MTAALGLAAMVSAAGGAGCVDPRADYEAFAKRPFAEPDAALLDQPTSPCAELLAQDLNGTYFTSCLVYPLMDNFSLVFEQHVDRRSDGTADLALSFTPLIKAATDITQTTGQRNTLPPTTVNAACVFDQPVGDLTLPRDANSTGRDLAGLDIRLRGRLLSGSRDCAVLTGSVPLLRLALEGDQNVCQFYRRTAGEPLPSPAIPGDYGCDPAGLAPLP